MAAVTAASVIGAPAVVAATPPPFVPFGSVCAGAGDAATSAAVVVDLGNGDVRRSCVRLDAASITGLDALQRAGAAPVARGFSGQGVAICALCGTGCSAGSDCLTCQAPKYWGYFRAEPGATSFTYSTVGAGATTVRPGGVEIWRWGTQSVAATTTKAPASATQPAPAVSVVPGEASTAAPTESSATGSPQGGGSGTADTGSAATSTTLPGAGTTGSTAGSTATSAGDASGTVPAPIAAPPGGSSTSSSAALGAPADRRVRAAAPGSASVIVMSVVAAIVAAAVTALVVIRRRRRAAAVATSAIAPPGPR